MKRLLAIMLLLSLVVMATYATAVSLEGSFSSGTSLTKNTPNKQGDITYYKKCWAQTKGYSGNHYVRAYIGGSNSSPNGAIADTQRQYSQGDIYRECQASKKGKDGQSPPTFPTGYAKYGT